MAELLKNPKICGACDKPDCKLKCACKLVFYCGAECQGKDWPNHKKKCSVALVKKMKAAKREHAGTNDLAVADARVNAGEVLRTQGRHREAERCYLEAYRIYKEVDGPDSLRLGMICRGIGEMYGTMARFDESMEMLREAARIFRVADGERGCHMGRVLRTMTETLRLNNKFKEALATCEEAKSIILENLGPEHEELGYLLTAEGNCYSGMGKQEKARVAYEESLRIKRITHGDDSDSVANCLQVKNPAARRNPKIRFRACIHACVRGDREGLLACHRAIYCRFTEKRIHFVAGWQNLGHIFMGMGKLEEARSHYEETLKIKRRVHGEKHHHVANALGSIAKVLRKQGDLEGALKMLKKALKIVRKVLGDSHRDVAMFMVEVADVHEGLEQHEESVQVREEVLEVYSRAYGIDTEGHADVYLHMARSQVCCGSADGALHSIKESIRIYRKIGSPSCATKLRLAKDLLDTMENARLGYDRCQDDEDDDDDDEWEDDDDDYEDEEDED